MGYSVSGEPFPLLLGQGQISPVISNQVTQCSVLICSSISILTIAHSYPHTFSHTASLLSLQPHFILSVSCFSVASFAEAFVDLQEFWIRRENDLALMWDVSAAQSSFKSANKRQAPHFAVRATVRQNPISGDTEHYFDPLIRRRRKMVSALVTVLACG